MSRERNESFLHTTSAAGIISEPQMPPVHEMYQILLFLVALTILTPLLGRFMHKVFEGERTFLTPAVGGLERLLYRLCRVEQHRDMGWKTYLMSVLVFNAAGFVVLFFLQLFQNWLPANPQGLPAVPWDLAFNTAVSFVTNTNWQSYAGETTLSYFTQMVGLTVQNFVSAATGIAVMLALIRGLVRTSASMIGNFWVDLVRATLYVLLPLTLLFAIVLAHEGVVQTFDASRHAVTLEGGEQTIPVGPAASQIAIKQVGTNGGGFFNANSAHPLENPTPFSNFLQLLAILLIPSSLVYTYGKMVGSTRQGWVLWGSMMALFVLALCVSLASEYSFGGMEGKEVRFGIGNSVLWSVTTTAASNGSVNAMHDSLSPLSGMIAMLNIMIGEVIFGGVGAGMYGMLVFVLLTVFIAGLMVGRSPEFLGKKIESFEVTMAVIAVLVPSAVILLFSAIAALTPSALSSISNPGPHGLSQILYAFSSAAGNNGSAFAGLNTNTVLYNILLGIAMLVGRFGVIVPVLAIAGSLVRKKKTPASAGTFPTDSLLFAVLLIGVIMIMGGLTFFPALSLGPVIEHLLMAAGRTF
jgi:K+-transporting ATPase ATPase A chain